MKSVTAAVAGVGAAASRPARALWIEINESAYLAEKVKSRPARALWIEIFDLHDFEFMEDVEAREGLVD